jgi:cytoskeletal protein RodZ
VGNNLSASGPPGPLHHSQHHRYRFSLFMLGAVAIVVTLIAATARAKVAPPSSTAPSDTSVPAPTDAPATTTVEPTTVPVSPTTTETPTTTQPGSTVPVSVDEPTTRGPAPTTDADSAGATTLPERVTTTSLGVATSTPLTTTAGGLGSIPATSTSASTTSTTSTTLAARTNPAVGCLFVTADADADARNGIQHRTTSGTPAADDDAVASPTDSACVGSDQVPTQPSVAPGRAVISPVSGRLVSFWTLLSSGDRLDRYATLRWRVSSSNGTMLVERSVPASAETGDLGSCGTRAGLLDALVTSGQLIAANASMCASNPGLRFREFTIEIGHNTPCGTYSAEAQLAHGTVTSTKVVWFEVSCTEDIKIDFTALHLPELSPGSTMLSGDDLARKQPWTLTNFGNEPIAVSVMFSPVTATESPMVFGTITGRIRRTSGQDSEIGQPTLTLCPGERAVIDVTISIPESAPVGAFSSSLSFSMTRPDPTVTCPSDARGTITVRLLLAGDS